MTVSSASRFRGNPEADEPRNTPAGGALVGGVPAIEAIPLAITIYGVCGRVIMHRAGTAPSNEM